MLGWWLGSILFIIVWVAIAFWPARVAARRAQLLRLLPLQPRLLPSGLIVAYLVSDEALHRNRY